MAGVGRFNAPLREAAFRAMWLATLASNIGTWMNDTGAAWLMTGLDPSPLMVALVQTAATLPFFLFAIPAGALADLLDRRRFLLAVMTFSLLAALGLTALTVAGLVTPGVLIACTFLLGIGNALSLPALQATVPDLVPRPLLGDAIALNGLGVNLSRAIGPAGAGFLISALGPASVFLLNALSFAAFLVVLARWDHRRPAQAGPPEQALAAIAQGIRFVAHAPEFRAVLWRIGGFMSGAGALWSLLPLVARQELGLSAAGYGLLLGAMGAGAIAAAFLLPMARERLGPAGVVAVGTGLFAAGMAAFGFLRDPWVLGGVLFLAGACWLALMSSFNLAAQSALPGWVRGRALSVYLVIFYGGLSLGSLVWGNVALLVGIPATMTIAAAAQVLAWIATARLPLRSGPDGHLDPSRHWPLPALGVTFAGDPIIVRKEFVVPEAERPRFLELVTALREARLRDGALLWRLEEDAATPGRFVETFQHANWAEHVRTHERFTVSDRAVEDAIVALLPTDQPPRVEHFHVVKG